MSVYNESLHPQEVMRCIDLFVDWSTVFSSASFANIRQSVTFMQSKVQTGDLRNAYLRCKQESCDFDLFLRSEYA